MNINVRKIYRICAPLLEKAIVDNPPACYSTMEELFRLDLIEKLDELRSFSDNASKFLLDLETQ